MERDYKERFIAQRIKIRQGEWRAKILYQYFFQFLKENSGAGRMYSFKYTNTLDRSVQIYCEYLFYHSNQSVRTYDSIDIGTWKINKDQLQMLRTNTLLITMDCSSISHARWLLIIAFVGTSMTWSWDINLLSGTGVYSPNSDRRQLWMISMRWFTTYHV